MGYTRITQHEFEHILERDTHRWKQVKDFVAKENIYLVESYGAYVKIFSSLENGVSRRVGSDAIRVIGWDNISNLPIFTNEHKVYRTRKVIDIEAVKVEKKS